MSRKKRIGTLLVLGIIALFGIAPAANATKYSFPGTNCVDENDNIVYAGGLVVNGNTTSNATFYCPLLRAGLTTTSISNINVYVTDGDDADGVRCFVRSCEPDGSPCSNSSIEESSSGGVGNYTLSLGSVTAFTNGAAFLECNVPDVDVGQSGIHSYRWND